MKYLLIIATLSLTVTSPVSAIKDSIENFELCAAFGGGITIPRGNATLFTEARYALGLSNTNTESDDNESTVKNRGIQAVFGITVPFKRSFIG